jgi:hypothetical protein
MAFQMLGKHRTIVRTTNTRNGVSTSNQSSIQLVSSELVVQLGFKKVVGEV